MRGADHWPILPTSAHGSHLPLPDDTTAGPALAGEYAAARERELLALATSQATEAGYSAEVYDAIAVVGLLNFANRAALATGIMPADDLR